MPPGGGRAPLWLGIDLGTQGCRVAAVDGTGRLVAAAERPLTSTRPAPGHHEQDPCTWTSAAAAACREVTDQVGGDAVAGIASCGTSGTFVLGDRNGRPVTPALMYDDARAVGELETVAAAWRDCADRNGYRVQPTWALPKLRRLLRTADLGDDVRLWHATDLLGSWLVGEPVAADTSHALKTGYDLVGGRWPVDACEAADIPVSVLPEVVRPGTTLGTVSRSAAADTGVSVGTPVVAGMTDGCASQIASGTVRPGQWNCALGTTLVLKGVSRDLLHDAAGAVYSHAHPDGGWLPGGASSSGAGVLASEFPGADPAHLDRAAAAYAATDVVRYPLSVPGERFPFVRADAEPFQLGAPRDDGERFAALLQGVAFVERLGLCYVTSLGAEVHGAVALTGGATRSAHWNQLRADVLGRQVRLPRHPDAAVGMAILAAAGSRSVAEAADGMVTISTTVDPRPEQTERYRAPYLRMVDELESRGYVPAALAASARAA